MIDMKSCVRCKPNPITTNATLYFDPKKETGLYLVQRQHLWDGKDNHVSTYRPVEGHVAIEICESLNFEENFEVVERFFRKKDEQGLYPICLVNILTHSLKMGRMPLEINDRFNRYGYFYDGKIGG